MNSFIKKYWPVILVAVVSIGCFTASVTSRSYLRDLDKVAISVGKRLSKRLDLLEAHGRKSLSLDTLSLDKIPDDMVIYRYQADKLTSWNNRFTIANDDLNTPFFARERMVMPEYGIVAPLSQVGPDWSFLNIGPKWYVAKYVDDGLLSKVIVALEIASDNADGNLSDYNPHLALPDFFSLTTLGGDCGEEVSVNSRPIFSIVCQDPSKVHIFADSTFRWIGLFLGLMAVLLLVFINRGLLACFAAILWALVFNATAQIWGSQMTDKLQLFSPSLYAGNSLWWSFGALLLINLTICFCIYCLYLTRRKIYAFFRRGRLRQWLLLALTGLMLLSVGGYAFASIADIVRNSNITFEIVWFRDSMPYTLMALVSYSLLAACSLLLGQMMLFAIFCLSGWKYKLLRLRPVLIFSLLIAILLLFLPERLAFNKEQQRTEVWANRLAVDRDLSLELRLRGIENILAGDEVVAMLSNVDGTNVLIARRIAENYLSRFASEYQIDVSTCFSGDAECSKFFARRLSGAEPIADGSRFGCTYQNNGKAGYVALFHYDLEPNISTRMLVEISSRSLREDNGYYSIFSANENPSSVRIPPLYSYGKYIDDKLVSYKGICPYPTVLTGRYKDYAQNNKGYFRSMGFVNFINVVDNNEVIFISRTRKNFIHILAALLTILSVVSLVVCLVLLNPYRKRRHYGIGTLRGKITAMLTMAIFLSLVVSAVISIKFVFERSETDTYSAMSSKIGTIRSMIEDLSKEAPNYTALIGSDFHNALVEVSANTKSDISLYTPSGRVFASTVSEAFDRMLLSTRMDRTAYCEIVQNHKRIYIAKEKFRERNYFNLYAPVFNRDDQMIAIVSSPFNVGANLVREALPHAVMMLILVVVLLVFFAGVSSSIVGKVFAPLTQLSRNMASVGKTSLKTIEYSGKDEITPLIESYNRMIVDLEDVTRKMAQNERDMAWSEMARQVAHEIKNPLTPMQLSIQRLIRLKQKNDPAWTEKFDELSSVILDQIAILTETANDFSTFAKLYTEDPVEIDLDQMLREQLTIFDSRDDISFTYLGMSGAVVLAPRPQLVRVIVNLLTNAIQAIESVGTAQGKINIYLRLAPVEGFYDVAVEDNGPGVPQENRERIFTPKFTTKSSGSGLGLAISRNIVQKCGGDITLGRSLSLGGASFTIRLPKKK